MNNMSDRNESSPVSLPAHPVPRMLFRISQFAAIFGGLILVGLAIMLVVTIVSRKLFFWQVAGDHELVQMIGAFSISLLFPWCHLLGGNVVVDMFTSPLPEMWKRLLDRTGSLLLAIVALLLAWRAGILAIEGRASGSISPILAWPVWIWQASLIPGLLLTAANAAYIAVAPSGLRSREIFAEKAGAQL